MGLGRGFFLTGWCPARSWGCEDLTSHAWAQAWKVPEGAASPQHGGTQVGAVPCCEGEKDDKKVVEEPQRGSSLSSGQLWLAACGGKREPEGNVAL